METPTIVLGVELMDRDHLHIEQMLAAAADAADADLPALYRDVAEELAAHFAREEAMMREQAYPGLHCHLAQHNVLLAQLHDGVPAHASAELRRRLTFAVPQLILSHVATMDRMTAAFVSGDLGQADFDVLRLPVSGSAR